MNTAPTLESFIVGASTIAKGLVGHLFNIAALDMHNGFNLVIPLAFEYSKAFADVAQRLQKLNAKEMTDDDARKAYAAHFSAQGAASAAALAAVGQVSAAAKPTAAKPTAAATGKTPPVAAIGAAPAGKSITRAQMDKMTPAAVLAHVRAGGKITD